ncbi:MAG: acyl-CoA thioesterase [Paludibacteraceae bacterium]|nr:acyl-CoA thioesterase [Paludibacteraceae bacterium]
MKTYQHIVTYYECDKMGVVHHSNYVRFMEEARVDWLDQLGYGFDRMEAEGVVSPVVSVSCQYKHPTTFKDAISIELHVEHLSTFKITFGYTMKVREQVVCVATSVHCFLENNHPVALEQRFPELYRNIVEVMEKK